MSKYGAFKLVETMPYQPQRRPGDHSVIGTLRYEQKSQGTALFVPDVALELTSASSSNENHNESSIHTSFIGFCVLLYRRWNALPKTFILKVLIKSSTLGLLLVILGLLVKDRRESSHSYFATENRYRSSPNGGYPLNKEFSNPKVRYSDDGLLDTSLHLIPGFFKGSTGSEFGVRTYEGQIPGPTLRVKPGDKLRITQINHLGENLINPSLESLYTNMMHNPNTSNIHVHGMHVSPSGKADNIYVKITPGKTWINEYDIVLDHQAGMFYYHPHYHGSSTIQSAALMAGAIIVEDDLDTVLPELSVMKEYIMVIQHVNNANGTWRNYVYLSKASNSTLQMRRSQNRWAPDVENFMTVNGIEEPILNVQPGEWTRWRMVNAGINDYLFMSVPGCEVYEIAADGVYYTEGPRQRDIVLMVVGSRKDIVVRCKQTGEYTLKSSRFLDYKFYEEYLGSGTDVYDGVILHVNVKGKELDMSLPVSLPSLPQRLFKDLRELSSNEYSSFNFALTQGKTVKNIDHENQSIYGINGEAFLESRISRRVPLGTVEEWKIFYHNEDGSVPKVNHPFHLHVNHFQIVNASNPDNHDFRTGDWRDTISIPVGKTGSVTIRWKANDFTGKSLAHCHIFSHHDLGMMMNFEITDQLE